MKAYEVDYAAKIDVFGTLPINAENKKEAEEFAKESIRDTYLNYFDVEVEQVREITV